MADVKISELSALTSPDGAEELVVNDSGTTKKITIDNLFNQDIDISGSVTADGLVVEGSSENVLALRVNDGTYGIDVGMTSTGGIVGTKNVNQSIDIKTYGGASTSTISNYTNNLKRQNIANNGDISFYEDTGTTPKFFWDASAESLGIGTSSPAQLLEIKGGANTSLRLHSDTDSSAVPAIEMMRGTNDTFGIDAYTDWRIKVDGGDLTIESADNGVTTNRLSIDYDGNVGIGVVPEAWHSTAYALQLGPDTALYDAGGYTILSNNMYFDAANKYISTDEASRYYQVNGTHTFQVAPSGTADSAISWNTAMTIKNDGQWTIGAFSASGGTKGIEFDNTSLNISAATTAGQNVVRFFNPNVEVGSIQTSGSSTSYNTSSDYRLKEADVPMTGATERVKALRPINFAWKVDGSRVDGFFAHELAEVVPEAATGTKDAMRDEEYEVTPATGDVFTAGSEAGFTEVSAAVKAEPAYYDVDGNVIKAEVIAQEAVHEAYDEVAEIVHFSEVEQPETLEEGQQWRETTAQVMGTRSVPDMQGIDQAKIVPLLTATIQELIARIEALEA
tara:strand:- start:29 stop:1717 length:1689 start_codon:yes stop_codon:yes gene_type:complete